MFNLVHLQFFYDAARLGSVTEAARNNYVSQSALSQGIRSLEKDLKVELTTHQKNRFILTDTGRLVFKHAKRLFAGISEMQEELSGQVVGTLTFACTNSIARALIPKALMNCRKEYPGLKVSFHRGSVRFIAEQLQKGNVDFAIVVDSDRFRGYEKLPIKNGVFSIYNHSHNRLQWSDGVYVDHIESREVQKMMELSSEFKVLEELSGWGMVEEFVKQGLGPGLLPDFITDERWMKQINSDIPNIPYSIVAIRQKGLLFSETMKRFIKLL